MVRVLLNVPKQVKRGEAFDVKLLISHPMESFAREAIASMIRAKKAGPDAGAQNVSLGFEIYTSENM